MDNSIPEYQITEQDYKNAKLIFNKLCETEWKLKDLIVEVTKKYAHLSELAYSLKLLPAMKEAKEEADVIHCETTHLFESEMFTLMRFKQLFDARAEEINKYLYTVSKAFYKPVFAQCVCEEQKDRKE